MAKPPKEVVDAICASLAMDDGWKFSKYEIWHPEKKIVIWIANELYGLEIKVANASYGSVVAYGVFSRWRWRIWNAVQRHISQCVTAAINDGKFAAGAKESAQCAHLR